MDSREFQNSLSESLKRRFGYLQVTTEWDSFERAYNIYSPRVDIAVGPYSTTPGQTESQEHNRLVDDTYLNQFLRELYEIHSYNMSAEYSREMLPNFYDVLHKNQNARCLLALEIENKTTRKHMMGSVINAASLGRIGIGIAFSDSALRTFIRILAYLHFLKQVEKNTYDTTNFLIVSKEQILQLLRQF
jgi:hypothetical protein